jgi:hypothetical protein
MAMLGLSTTIRGGSTLFTLAKGIGINTDDLLVGKTKRSFYDRISACHSACLVHKGTYRAWPNSWPDNRYGLYAGQPGVVTDGLGVFD